MPAELPGVLEYAGEDSAVDGHESVGAEVERLRREDFCDVGGNLVCLLHSVVVRLSVCLGQIVVLDKVSCLVKRDFSLDVAACRTFQVV